MLVRAKDETIHALHVGITFDNPVSTQRYRDNGLTPPACLVFGPAVLPCGLVPMFLLLIIDIASLRCTYKTLGGPMSSTAVAFSV